MLNGQDIVIHCKLLDGAGGELATAKISQPLSLHVTPITLEAVFDCSVRLQPNRICIFCVSVFQRAHFLTGIKAQFTFINFNFGFLITVTF